jgi:hypothetical protein
MNHNNEQLYLTAPQIILFTVWLRANAQAHIVDSSASGGVYDEGQLSTSTFNMYA